MSFWNQKKTLWFLLALIVGLGFFLRTVHFGEYLHFELDQARDARIIDDGLRGDFFDLPLLGPRAGGTYLRLPPAFYYLEFLSAKMFGPHPVGMAFFVALLSTASIPIFFFFVRRFFGRNFSLGLTSLFAVSTFLVLYGRFAWNPNPLPFFLLLGFFSLLKAVDSSETRPGRWLLLSAFMLSIATELHFLAFVAVPAIVFFFLLWKRPRFSWRAWLGVVGLVTLLYMPMVLNERETGGRNTQEFFKAVSGKSGKGDHPIVNKLIKNVLEQANGYVVLVSGYERSELPTFKTEPILNIICDESCRIGMRTGLFSLALSGLGLFFLVWRIKTTPAGDRKDFLVLNLLWLFFVFGVLTPIAFSYSPRFFLLVAPLPFVLLGLVGHALYHGFRESRWAGYFLLALCLGLVGCNLFFLNGRFSALAKAATEPVQVEGADRILKDKSRVTLGQQNRIVDYMQKRSEEEGVPVYMFSEPEHRRALKYLLERRGIQNAVFGFDGIYREGVYFLIIRTDSNLENGTKKYRLKYDEIDRVQFGTLTLFEFRPKEEFIGSERQDFSLVKPQNDDNIRGARYTWREWWTRQGAMREEDETLDETLP
ncbi:MAG: glycosyltransferase family 39 protein [Candidatus Moraniibacteriota bacterium]